MIDVSIVFGLVSRKPTVQVQVDSHVTQIIQLTPEAARELAAQLTAAAEQVETEAFLVKFLSEVTKFSDSYLTGVLAEFRAQRVKHG